MKLSGTAVVILGMLGRRTRSGYDIKQAVDRSTGFFWATSYGQLYPELARLEAAGLVASETAPTGARRRKVHRLTDAGRHALSAWLHEPGGSVEVRDEYLLKLFFADLDPAAAPTLVGQLRRHHARMLHRLEAIRADPDLPGDTFPVRVLDLGIDHHRSWVQRLDDLDTEADREADREVDATPERFPAIRPDDEDRSA